jgi:hypothetical protein
VQGLARVAEHGGARRGEPLCLRQRERVGLAAPYTGEPAEAQPEGLLQFVEELTVVQRQRSARRFGRQCPDDCRTSLDDRQDSERPAVKRRKRCCRETGRVDVR